VPSTSLNTVGSLTQPQKMVHNICVSKLKNRAETVFSTLLGGAGKHIKSVIGTNRIDLNLEIMVALWNHFKEVLV